MKIVCDSCGTKYSIADEKVRGKVFKIRCKKCSHIIVVRGGETGGPEAAAAPAAEGGWHLVIDGEQVGPLGDADVRTKIERGEVKADTYTWKEGFADWVKLSAVPEFAGLVAEDVGGAAIGGGEMFTAGRGGGRAGQRRRTGPPRLGRGAIAVRWGRRGGQRRVRRPGGVRALGRRRPVRVGGRDGLRGSRAGLRAARRRPGMTADASRA